MLLDEFQHKGYDEQKEEERYHEIVYESLGVCKSIWIRFNPDPWRDEDGEMHDEPFDDRLEILKRTINDILAKMARGQGEEGLAHIITLFYNGNKVNGTCWAFDKIKKS